MYQKSKRQRLSTNVTKKISHTIKTLLSISKWWQSFREPCYDADVMVSDDRKMYFFYEEENRGDEYWCMGLIGERPGACEGMYAYNAKQLLELFPCIDTRDILPNIDFKNLGITLAKKANFTFLSDVTY